MRKALKQIRVCQLHIKSEDPVYGFLNCVLVCVWGPQGDCFLFDKRRKNKNEMSSFKIQTLQRKDILFCVLPLSGSPF